MFSAKTETEFRSLLQFRPKPKLLNSVTFWTQTFVLSREKNAGRQCHFKIWLDCHKCWGSSSIDLLSGGSSSAWESKEILEQF
jgi:hypothetical protein